MKQAKFIPIRLRISSEESIASQAGQIMFICPYTVARISFKKHFETDV